MSWIERTQEAAYTTPSGVRFDFPYLNADREFDKQTSAYNFPDVGGTYIQDLNSTDKRYAMRVIFSGEDHDLQSIDFEKGLREVGKGKLDHPRDGVVDVVPFGTIKFREDLVVAANQTVVEVEFWQTTIELFPQGSTDQSSAVLSSSELLDSSISVNFSESLALDTAFDRVRARDLFSNSVGFIKNSLSISGDVKNYFNTVFQSISEGIEDFDAETLAAQSQILFSLSAAADIKNSIKLESFTNTTSQFADGRVKDSFNDFKNNELQAINSVSASIKSSVNNDFAIRSEAVAAAESIVSQFDKVNEWAEENYSAFPQVDTGDYYKNLQESVSLAASYLVSLSFSLLQERTIVLSRNRTMIDLVGELYGEIDGKLDFFIQTNELSGDEFLEIKAGREIVYYL